MNLLYYGDSFVQFMKTFAGRKRLKQKATLVFRDDRDRPRIFCDEPVIVARFASEVRQQAVRRLCSDARVLMRGQTDNYPGMVPAIFRRPNDAIDHGVLLKAEKNFAAAVATELRNNRRFARDDLAALLQHYGYKTTWLDVVDNLWTAVWFATHSIRPKCAESKKPSGWIYFLVCEAAGSGCRCIDLRLAHHGLSVRVHTQHGWSLRAVDEDLCDDLNRWVVACVEFPIDRRWWQGCGYMLSPAFLFPPASLDHTLQLLVEKKVDGVAKSVEGMERPKMSLGRLFPHR